jgi:L-lactate dehydrogenase complex protein LldG
MDLSASAKARENIMRKLRSGLERATLPMPYPEVEHADLANAFTKQDATDEEIFATEFIKLGGKFVFCADEIELIKSIAELHDSADFRQMLCSEPYLLQLFYKGRLDFIEPADPALEGADACITGCEALVARTGSILLTSKQPLGRIAPVFYPVHIVVAFASQVVPDIADALALMQQRYGNELPSMINLNTGPSRTADIEKTLVVGVHGPKEVYCFYVNK